MKRKRIVLAIGSVLLWGPVVGVHIYSDGIEYRLIGLIFWTYCFFLGALKKANIDAESNRVTKRELLIKIVGLLMSSIAVFLAFLSYSEEDLLRRPIGLFLKVFGCLILAMVGLFFLLYRQDQTKDIQKITPDNADKPRA